MKIHKLCMLGLNLWFISAKSMEREESYKRALLEYCGGKENKLKKAIRKSQKKHKEAIIMLSDENSSIHAMISPFKKRVTLSGPGYQASEYEFKEFLNILEAFKTVDRKTKSNKKCLMQ